MKVNRSFWTRIVFVVLFAVAMAYLEAAVVVYLRRIYGITELAGALATFDAGISLIEVGREAATMVMLFAISMIATENLQSRVGHFLLLFGVWDIFYYGWLKVFLNWPATIFDNDLLFLIPLPWWGPVLTPMFLALVMAAAGIRLIYLDQREVKVHLRWLDWALLIGGTLIVLYAFMADALATLPCSTQVLAKLRPSTFRWPIYGWGMAMMIIVFVRAMFLRTTTKK